ncbi:MAG: site-specific DNA-methyltransferase [Nanoarchaeota archaeon]|nr:site-specific DNA-methyltransferase [Nanoarchaeota archaeon]
MKKEWSKTRMEIINKKINDLIPYINNTRTHSDEQVQQIASSIKEFGFTNPCLIDEKGGLIAGHGRIMAAKLLQLNEIPTITLKGLTEAQIKAYIIADNKLALNAGWDEELLKVEIEALQEMNFNIDLLGFDMDELDDLGIDFDDNLDLDEDKADEVPELEEKPCIKRGDLIELGINFQHRVLCGDSTSEEDVARLMDGKKADMVFTDPPYGMFLDADYSNMESKFKGSSGGTKYDNIKGDHEDFKPELIETVFKNFGYCNEIFLWGADYYSENLIEKNKGSWIVWDKRGDVSADKMFGSAFELCWSKARHKRMLARVKWAGIFGMEKEHDKKRQHPTQKPVELIDWFFDYFSLKDKKIVVDLYGGSGSTLLSAENYDKFCCLMELDEKYAQVIIQRYCDYTSIDTIKINGKEVSWSQYKEDNTK